MKEEIKKFAAEKLEGEVAAGIDHFERIYNIAKSLGLKYDDDILYAASFLHDVCEDEPHWEDAARIAGEFLPTIGFPAEKIPTVQEAILHHISSAKPESNEAILVHDADLIDFLGATGIVRLSIGAWDWMGKGSLKEFLEVFKKFRKNAYEGLVLDESRKRVEEKVKFMDQAINELEKELL
ncbi:MAG: HD domain-containing protein [Patescibacteria group bacterium]|nr:HD domain-containing protein [Patescibacteria group bacterium]